MRKVKLKNIRISKGVSQDQMAEVICKDKSAYCRREKGEVRISMDEWEKMSKFLNVPLEDIFESEEESITDENYLIPMAFVEHLHDYIRMLKQEITQLKEQLKNIKP